MPIKHQSACYRTFDGVRWPNLCDMISELEEWAVAEAKAAGKRIRIRTHPDGYRQAFIHPDDLAPSA